MEYHPFQRAICPPVISAISPFFSTKSSFRRTDGTVISPVIVSRNGADPESKYYSDPSALIDEPDTLEALPALFADEAEQSRKAEPSWWNSTYFDEIYHARTAYEFLQGTVPYENSHPPLGKELMSVCVAVFGMTPFGWRLAGAIAGILMLPSMYLLGKQLRKKHGLLRWPAC
jgi:Dolichyl-phosphate-mannose--protein O-mannosyl transferase